MSKVKKFEELTPVEINRDIKKAHNMVDKIQNPRTRDVIIAGKQVVINGRAGYVNRIKDNFVYVEMLDNPGVIEKFDIKTAVKGYKPEKEKSAVANVSMIGPANASTSKEPAINKKVVGLEMEKINNKNMKNVKKIDEYYTSTSIDFIIDDSQLREHVYNELEDDIVNKFEGYLEEMGISNIDYSLDYFDDQLSEFGDIVVDNITREILSRLNIRDILHDVIVEMFDDECQEQFENLKNDIDRIKKEAEAEIEAEEQEKERQIKAEEEEKKAREKEREYKNQEDTRTWDNYTYRVSKFEDFVEEKSKPSAGLTKKQKSSVVKKAVHGGDIGKPGKHFKEVVDKAKKSGARDPEAVAAAAMWKNIKRK